MNLSVWLTYDLGVSGDYQGLYSWLDDYEATECGNNVAYIKYDIPETIKTDKDFVKYLLDDLNEKVNFTPTNRIYIVRRSLERDKTIGSYIMGKRKANPWEGFGTKIDNTIDA
jgi:hypothetical protein